MPFNCEVNLNPTLQITNTNVQLGAEGPDSTPIWLLPGSNPTNSIISTHQTLTVNASWTVTGPLATIMTSACRYRCQILLEKMGPAEALPGIFTTQVNHIVGFGPQNYNAAITIPQLSEGVYRVVFSFNLLGPSGAPLPVAGFDDLGFIQVFPN